jgi:glucokinase
MDIVSVDIGGTHARFTIANLGDDGKVTLGKVATLHTKDHASFESAWAHFAEINGALCPRGGSGDCRADQQRFDQIHQQPLGDLSGQLHDRLGDAVTLVNDFGAVAHAVAHAGPEYFTHLSGPDVPLPEKGTISIPGPGTGLGVAQLWRDGPGSYHVQATEGGHIDFAPLDAIDDALLARLRQRHRRVSVERVVSGPAIVDIYETLAVLEGKPITPLDDRTIWTLGTDPESAARTCSAPPPTASASRWAARRAIMRWCMARWPW